MKNKFSFVKKILQAIFALLVLAVFLFLLFIFWEESKIFTLLYVASFFVTFTVFILRLAYKRGKDTFSVINNGLMLVTFLMLIFFLYFSFCLEVAHPRSAFNSTMRAELGQLRAAASLYHSEEKGFEGMCTLGEGLVHELLESISSYAEVFCNDSYEKWATWVISDFDGQIGCSDHTGFSGSIEYSDIDSEMLECPIPET